MPVRTQRDASRKFRELIAAERYVLEPTHGKRQLLKRDISWAQVIAILSRGTVVQRPYQTTSLKWRTEYVGLSAGSRVKVVAELQEGKNELCLVITAFRQR